MRKSRIRIFLEKRGYFGNHLREFGEKGVNFDIQCFTLKNGGSFGMKRQCFTTKKKSVFYHEKGVVFELKSQCFVTKKKKKKVIFKLENKDGYHFFQ